MKPSQRRRSRLNSATYATDQRWRPSKLMVVMVVGLFVGVLLGIVGNAFRRGPSMDERYFVLASDLYNQGASAGTIRDRLLNMGFHNPSVAVLSVADRLATSSNQQDQRAATSLQQLAQALASNASTIPTAVVVAQSVATDVPVAENTPIVPTPAPTMDPATPVPAVVATPNAAPVTPSATPSQYGVIHTSDGQPGVLRREPNSTSPKEALLKNGTKVQVLDIVHGQAIDPKEPRWYHVQLGQLAGYIYFKLVQTGG